MESMWMLYWITRAITMKDVAGPMFFMCLTVVGLSLLIYAMSYGESWQKGPSEYARKLHTFTRSLFFGLAIFFGIAYILCPTKEEAAVIVAGGAVVEAAKSETAQRLAGKSVQILENSLDNILGKQAVEKAGREKSNSH